MIIEKENSGYIIIKITKNELIKLYELLCPYKDAIEDIYETDDDIESLYKITDYESFSEVEFDESEKKWLDQFLEKFLKI